MGRAGIESPCKQASMQLARGTEVPRVPLRSPVGSSDGQAGRTRISARSISRGSIIAWVYVSAVTTRDRWPTRSPISAHDSPWW